MKHFCVIENQVAFRQNRDAMENIIESLSNPRLREDIREQLEGSLASGEGRAKVLLGQYVGMILALTPDSDKVTTMVEKFIADGGPLAAIQDGMKAMKRELDQMHYEATKEVRKAAWEAMTTTEQREAKDNKRRFREEHFDESQHHGEMPSHPSRG
ncbi:hypothetical protein [Paraburkholderia sp. BCC1884]|uniref:hypothetical protein n=1 Tax=Paraburkholderia sp. BCC1884 TaxID=2562668 RepID=UPI001183F533|nr:hypothetical protein [Paraburkholderia sp. BCC1884]